MTPAKTGDLFKPIDLGGFRLTGTGVDIASRPSWQSFVGALEFAKHAHRASGFWLADLLRYAEGRPDWADRLSQVIDATGLSPKTLRNVKAVGAIPVARRRAGIEFGHHEAVSGMPDPVEQAHWLEMAEREGWTVRELRLNLRAARRAKIIEGQALLEGQYHVIYADPPWIYGNRPPSGSGSAEHYPGMTVEALCALPVAAHARPDAVLFLWATAPMLYENPGPREVLEAWGFQAKTQLIWDKVRHNFGNYFSVRHELLILATRGSATPDRPTPMFDSVYTERQEGEHSAKPAGVRRMIEAMYDGPYLELFARERVEGWTPFGNDARLARVEE